MKICCHFLVSGRVQGVFYRANTQKTAISLLLTGWVRNMPDGRVEITACGEREQIDEFIEWLWQGPPAAEVSNVEQQVIAWQEFDDFKIKSI